MKNLSLILRILAIVAAIAAAGIYFVVQGKLTEKQAQLESSQAATVATQAKLDTANGEISTLQTTLSDTTTALTKEKSKSDSLNGELYSAKQELTLTKKQLSTAKTDLQDLSDTEKSLRASLLKTEQALVEASKEAELAQLTERVKELEDENADLTSELQSEKALNEARKAQTAMASGTGLPAVNFTTNTAGMVEPVTFSAQTTIASISLEDGLLVLDSTPELELNPGVEVTLVVDLIGLGKVRIISNENNLAIADILPGAKTSELSAGTTVSLLR